MPIFYEDLAVGDEFDHGSYTVTEAEILEFAERYDPQWFHTDPERAREESMYGELIASGWHTAAVTMRLLVDGFLSEAAALGAKGVDELRWLRPVFPGDELAAETAILEKRPESAERGLIHAKTTTSNGDDTVYSMIGLVMIARRNDE